MDPDGPVHEQRYDATEGGAGTAVTLTELTTADTAGAAESSDGVSLVQAATKDRSIVDHDVFDSIYNPGKLAVLISWRSPATAADWGPTTPAGHAAVRHRVVRVVRDYGMFDRREAPQYYPDAIDNRSAV